MSDVLKTLHNLVSLPARKPAVGITPADVVHRENKWRLLRYRARAEGQAHHTPLLMVPSLINRWYVLDLMAGKSLAEHLVNEGFDLYCIDWGTPGPEDRYLTFDEVCDRYLGRALRKVCRTSGVPQAHVLGYCMGGTLTAIHAAAHPERIASLVELAAPVRFDDGGLLSRWTRTPTFDVGALVRGAGNVPWPLMQGAFHMLRPTLTLSKTVHLLDRASDDLFLDGFLAIETWGNDNVSLPGAFYERYIEDLYQKDLLVQGQFVLSGRRVRLDSVRCPLLVISFEHDSIVPTSSAAALVDHVRSGDVTHWHLPGGHVGAVVSRGAQKSLWPKLSAWWSARDVVPATDSPRRPHARGPHHEEPLENPR